MTRDLDTAVRHGAERLRDLAEDIDTCFDPRIARCIAGHEPDALHGSGDAVDRARMRGQLAGIIVKLWKPHDTSTLGA